MYKYFAHFYLIVICILLAGDTMLSLVKSCIGTKFTSQFGDLIAVSIDSGLEEQWNVLIFCIFCYQTFSCWKSFLF